MTSGEVRVFVENRCSYMDAIDRAKEIFAELKMDETDRQECCIGVCCFER